MSPLAVVESGSDGTSWSLGALDAELRNMPFQSIPSVLERSEPHWCAPGVYRVRASTTGRQWTLSGWGEELHAVPVFEGPFPIADSVEQMALSDIVAWPPDRPARWCFRTGEATLLGRQHLVWALQDRTPLNVYSTPLDWVMAGGDGVCILHADGVAELFGVKALHCHDANQGPRLDRALKRMVPIVMVPDLPV